MFLCEVALIIVLLGLSNARLNNQDIPEPEIQVFHPKGLRLSIDDTPGLTLVLFHINVYRKSGSLDDRHFSQYIRRKYESKWSFTKRQLRINIGDRIMYSVFVVKDGIGFVSAEGECQVEELAHQMPRQYSRGKNESKSGMCRSFNATLPQPVTELPETVDDTKHYLNVCEQTIINATQTLISLRSQLQELQKTNQQLVSAFERYPDAKKLTISGRIPPDGDAASTVSFLLKEKLGLMPDIVSAVRNANNSITFEVATLDDKIEILEAAKEQLLHSKIVIN